MSDEVVQEFFSIGDVCQLTDLKPVSYTHLTLPTSDLV